MKKLIILLLLLFSTNLLALSEPECTDRTNFLSQIGFEFRDHPWSLEQTRTQVVFALALRGFPVKLIQDEVNPIINWVFDEKNKNKKTEEIAQDFYNKCVETGKNNGTRLPRTRNEGRSNGTYI